MNLVAKNMLPWQSSQKSMALLCVQRKELRTNISRNVLIKCGKNTIKRK